MFSIKSFKLEENLTKCLTDAVQQISAESYKHLANWIIDYSQTLLKQKHKIDQQKQNITATATASDESVPTTSASIVSDQEKEKIKSLKAEKRRAKLMSQLNKQQKDFIKNYQDLYDETKSVTSALTPTVSESSLDAIEKSRLSGESLEERKMSLNVGLGPNQTQYNASLGLGEAKKRYHCILCQEDDEIGINKPPMVLCCYIQSSRVLSKNRVDFVRDFDEFDPLFVKNELTWGINTTSCGHVMHANCWQK